MDSGVAIRPIDDMDAYRDRLERYVFRSGSVMKGVFNVVRASDKRMIYSGGEDLRVLRTVQMLGEERVCKPLVIGRRDVIERGIANLGLRIRPDTDFELVDPGEYDQMSALATDYHDIMGRRGVWPSDAEGVLRGSSTALGAMLLHAGAGDAMIAGPFGTFAENYRHVIDIVGLRDGVHVAAGMQLLILDQGTYFIADGFVNYKPSVEELVEITLLAASEVRRFGIVPKVALVSHSNFGGADSPSSQRMRQAVQELWRRDPGLEVDGEMQTDAAVNEEVRRSIYPNSRLTGSANLLVMPNIDAANITFNALKALGNGVSVGPLMLGLRKPVHILNRTVTTRGAVNLSAIALADTSTS